MAFLSNMFGTKSKMGVDAIPVLPSDIFGAAELEMRDIIAPSAIEIGSSTIKIGDKISKTLGQAARFQQRRLLSTHWVSPAYFSAVAAFLLAI